MRKVLTVLIIIAVLLLSLFLQITFLNNVTLFGIKANLGIIVIAGLGLLCGRAIGGLTGAFYGLMVDVAFGKTLGVSLILYTLLGLITGRISNKFSKDNKTSLILIVAVASILFEYASYLFTSLLSTSSLRLISATMIIVVETAYNFILTTLLYKLIVGLGEIINKAKNSYYLL